MVTNSQSPSQARPVMTKFELREDLRRRILAIVNERQHTTEAEIWRADAPNYLPWEMMVEEIQTLDRQKKLRREVVAPGHILIHSITAPPVPANPPTAVTETAPASPTPVATITKTAAKAARPSARASKPQKSKRKTKAAK